MTAELESTTDLAQVKVDGKPLADDNRFPDRSDIDDVTAFVLKTGGAELRLITCTSKNTDYADGIKTPKGTRWLRLYCKSEFRVALDEATAAAVDHGASGVGWMFPAGLAEPVRIELTTAQQATGAVVHVQSDTDLAKVYYNPIL